MKGFAKLRRLARQVNRYWYPGISEPAKPKSTAGCLAEGQTMTNPSEDCAVIKTLLAKKTRQKETINGSRIIPLPKGKTGKVLRPMILQGTIPFHEVRKGEYFFIKSELEGVLELETMSKSIEITKQIEKMRR